MSRSLKEAEGQALHYDDHEQLRNHLAKFISAYNFGRRMKTLKRLTPYEFICKCWTSEPSRLILNPLLQMTERNNQVEFQLKFDSGLPLGWVNFLP